MKIYSAQHRAIVEAPIMDEPSALNYADCLRTNKDLLEFHKDLEAYNEWLSTHIPVLPEHQALFKDGQEVKEGIDYEVKDLEDKYECYYERPAPSNVNTLYAVPIKQQVSEEGGGYYFKLFKFFSDQHDLTLLDSEIQDIIHAVNKFQSEEDKERLPQQEMVTADINFGGHVLAKIEYTGDFSVVAAINGYGEKFNPDDIIIEYSKNAAAPLQYQLSEALAKIKSQEAEIADLRKQLK